MLEEIKHAENKRINDISLNIKVNETVKTKNISMYSAKGAKGIGNNDITYDRIFLFGSLCTNKCFVIISSTKRNTAHLIHLLSKFTDES